MEKIFSISFSNKIPLFILVIWSLLVGLFIWQRVNQNSRPPLFDALTYYEKAQNTWRNIHSGFPQNPLNVEPAGRPPGTVLLSYPFGFYDDYNGFLFRSVFMPFLLWMITILILVWPKREPNNKKSYWSATQTVSCSGQFLFSFNLILGMGLTGA